MVKKKYWVYDPISNVTEFFEHEEVRNELINLIIEDCKDVDGWNEDLIEEVRIGESVQTHILKQTNIKKRPETLDEDGYDNDGLYWPDDCDIMCDYEPVMISDES